jgi:hypothetical protein
VSIGRKPWFKIVRSISFSYQVPVAGSRIWFAAAAFVVPSIVCGLQMKPISLT